MQCSKYFSCLVYATCLFLVACASSPQAPVIERTPGSTSTKAPAEIVPADKAAVPETDWRPEVHVVKKGDTLRSIGLQYGFDYQEIAQKNNLQPPFNLYIGQQLRLPVEAKTPVPAVDDESTADGVIITPLKTEPGIQTGAEPVTTTDPGIGAEAIPAKESTGAGDLPILNSPKALREPYSELALATPSAGKTIEAAKLPEAKSTDQPKAKDATKPDTTSSEAAVIDWAWPANGKLVAGFNETSAKGIDIAGTPGQAVTASAAGKVIYSGSDLRGYGKLVIIKHNKTYLSVYAHNSQLLVKEGQLVSKGQKIAEMGSTDSDRVKLHFEIRQQGKSVDPAKYLPANSPG